MSDENFDRAEALNTLMVLISYNNKESSKGRRGSSMRMLALNRKPRINPILFTLSIIPHVSVAQRRQVTGGVL